MRNLEALFAALTESQFRRRFVLQAQELLYLEEKGLSTILDHARDFIQSRLAPAEPANDGWQTPMRGHPVFVAQHATATCCRSCLAKWHRISKGRALTEAEIGYVLTVLQTSLEKCASDCRSKQRISATHKEPYRELKSQQRLF